METNEQNQSKQQEKPASDASPKLERLPDEAMIAGVAAGFAEYFKVDITVMRLIFIAIALATSGGAVIAYLILAVAMPARETKGSAKAKTAQGANTAERTAQLRQYAGIGLAVFGLWLLLAQIVPDLWRVQWNIIWPAALVLLGIWIVTRSKK